MAVIVDPVVYVAANSLEEAKERFFKFSDRESAEIYAQEYGYKYVFGVPLVLDWERHWKV